MKKRPINKSGGEENLHPQTRVMEKGSRNNLSHKGVAGSMENDLNIEIEIAEGMINSTVLAAEADVEEVRMDVAEAVVVAQIISREEVGPPGGWRDVVLLFTMGPTLNQRKKS
jgi:hypothetical protein